MNRNAFSSHARDSLRYVFFLAMHVHAFKYVFSNNLHCFSQLYYVVAGDIFVAVVQSFSRLLLNLHAILCVRLGDGEYTRTAFAPPGANGISTYFLYYTSGAGAHEAVLVQSKGNRAPPIRGGIRQVSRAKTSFVTDFILASFFSASYFTYTASQVLRFSFSSGRCEGIRTMRTRTL